MTTFERKMTLRDRFTRMLKLRYVKVLSYSGKGGTGKSLSGMNLALRCAEAGLNVGLLDIDLEMNSVERGMGFRGEKATPDYKKRRLKPIIHKDYPNLKMFALSLMPFMDTEGDETILWGGEYQRNYIYQLLYDVDWGKLDIMIFDTPAGIGDTILALTSICKKIDYSMITGLNNLTSTDGVAKAVTTLNDMKIPILGVIANQAYYDCPHCGERSHPLGKNQVKKLCKKYDLYYAGPVPLSNSIYKGMESGKPYVESEAYDNLFNRLLEQKPKLAKKVKVNKK